MELERYLEDRVAAGDFPGAVCLVREGGRDALVVARGEAVVTPDRISVAADTIFDLASLTKPLATTLLVALELEAGRLSLDDPVAAHLAEFDRPDRRRLTLRHLLTHTSGLPAWRPLYVDPGDPDRAAEAVGMLPLEYEPGTRVLYSDPTFIALGLVLERLAGQPLDALFAERVAGPLGLQDTGYRPAPRLRSRIAASEAGNEYERQMCGDAAASYGDWREDVIWGEVHDGNARFLGGVSGHAGLFGTASETALVAEQFLPGGRLLCDESTFALFRENLTPGLDEHRSVGWMLASTPDSAAGPALPSDAFGHLGFTGTSVWVDPHAGRVYVLLTNRTHPTRRELPFNAIRRRVHELAARELE